MESKLNNFIFSGSLVFFAIITFLGMDMYLPALPTIAREMGLTSDMAQYTITVWLLGSASLQLIVGPLSDYYGRKIFFISGIIVFIISSVLIVYSTDYSVILIARFLQGTTVCTTMVSGMATIHNVFNGRLAVQVISVLMTISMLAPLLGPVAGAFVVKNYSWQVIFEILAVAAILALIFNVYFMPNTLDEKASIKTKDILLTYKEIICNPSFVLFLSVYVLLSSVFFMWVVESPFIIISGLGRGEVYYGLVQIPVFGGFILGGQLTRYLIKFYSVENVVKFGILSSLLGAALFLFYSYFLYPDIYIVSSMSFLSLGSAMAFGAVNRYAVLSSDKPTGSKVAIISTGSSLGGVISTFLVSLFNNMTFLNIALPIFIATSIAVLLFFLAEIPDIDSI
jgi:Bcr/CflA subfamily drug resistance transporter